MSDDDVFEVLGDEEDAEIFGEVDWDEAFNDTPTEVEWLVEPFIEAGALVAMYSPPKAGKSLLALEVAASLATGRRVLSEAGGRCRHVLYVDFENRPKDFVDRLRAMNFTPAELKGWLHYLTFPTMDALDTPEGGAQLHANAIKYEADLVVIDTVSRVIEGGENDNDTFKDMYRHSLSRLKRDGIACLRLDHTGKDAEKGQRGASAKNADVDVVWSLTATKTRVRLGLAYSRQAHYPLDITMTRETVPFLRHDMDRVTEMGEDDEGVELEIPEPSERVLKLVARLDDACVPLDYGRTRVTKEFGIGGNAQMLGEAINYRRDRG